MSGSLAHHREAERCMGWADFSRARGREDECQRFYGLAAKHEERAYEEIPPDWLRTRGIIAISVVACWRNAGQPEKSRQRAVELAEDETLPDYYREQLREMATG